MLQSIARSSHWLQSLVIRRIARFSTQIEHNVEKIRAIKKAFFLVNCEETPGDYLEFGMFEGASFCGAMECHLATQSPQSAVQRTFRGFDSFDGFKYFDEQDKHPFFQPGAFKSSYEKTQKRVHRQARGRVSWEITPGYLEETIAGRTAREMGVERAAIVFIDCDLGGPAAVALDFAEPALDAGSVVILDDYFAYGGSLDRGVAGAFADFQDRHPELRFRRLLDYGYGGQAFVVAFRCEAEGFNEESFTATVGFSRK